MTSDKVDEYKGFVAEQLAELTPFLQEYALGDFSRDFEIPEEENEFTELFVALKLFIDDIRELIRNLEESEERFRGTFEQAAVGVAHVSPEGRLLLVNSRLSEILGFSEKELLDLSFMDFTHPDDLDADVTLFNELAAGTRKSYSMEKRYIRKDGQVFWGALTVSMIQHPDGSPKYAIGVVEDITDRKAISKALGESEEKFRTLVTNNEEIIYLIARDGTFLLSEGKGLAKLGLEPGQVVGQSVFDLYKDYPEMLDHMRRTFEGESLTVDVNVADNHFRSWYTPHLNQEGEVIGLLGLAVNITEQKKAEESLQNSLRVLATAEKVAAMGSWEWDLVSNQVTYSDNALRLYGLSAEEYDGDFDSVFRFFHPDDVEDVKRNIVEMLAEKKPREFKYRIIRPDGSVRSMEGSNEMTMNDAEEVVRLVGHIHDITEQEQTESELKNYREHLEDLVEERTSELRQTINLMAGREVRMSDLKRVIQDLRMQLEEAGLSPKVDDPLKAEL